MHDNCSKQKQLDIWEDVLKKNVKSNLLNKAPTVQQKDNPYDVQVFELLVAESLNLQDHHTNWEVTKASHDSGVDLLGTDMMPCRTPFTTTQYRLLSVGQVKRSKRSYKYEDFRSDIRKARGYWLNSDLFHGNSPKQFLFILSTDGRNGVKVLQKHLEHDLTHNTDVQLKNDQLTHVQLIDAAYIIKSWKFNLSYFEEILEDALSPEQLSCFHEYVSSLDCSWLSVSVRAPESGGVGEPVTYSLLIELPVEDLTLTLFARWVPPEQDGIQLLHPLRMVDPRVLGALVRVKGQAEVQIKLRSMRPGLCDFGSVELYSEERMCIASAPLNPLDIYDGFCPAYFDHPNHTILQDLKKYIFDKTPTLIPISIIGCGGIGKSSLISEALVTAAEKGYFSSDLMQPKDLLHPRSLLRRLFTEFVRPNIPQNTFLPDVPFHLKTYLGGNYRQEWEEDIAVFFCCPDQEVNTESLAQCLVTLLLSAAQESPVFLWMSNMHWASKETLEILRIAIDELDANQEMLGGRILWIFEGRSGEVLSYDQQAYYPVYLERFLSNNLLRSYTLSMWEREDSRRFLQQLFVDPKGDRILYHNYFERLLDCSCGVPMQILELIRVQLEQDILQLDPDCEYRLRIHRFPSGDAGWSDSFSDTIDRRIHFYRQKCSDLIDFCVILAALDDSIPTLLTSRLMKWLHTEYVGIDALVFQSGFIVQTGQDYHFYHEHYQTAFRMQPLKNRKLLSECLAYFKRLPSKEIRDRYAEIKLHLLADDADLTQLRRDIISLLNDSVPKSIEQSLYKLLLQLPPLAEECDISRCTVLFMLCESYVQEGSWKAGQDCLKQLLMLPKNGDTEEMLIHVKAHQELSNILGDRLLFEQAIQVAEDGLELAEMYLDLHSSEISYEQRAELYLQREKLLARLAVCHWFAGDPARGLTFQRQCYDSAVQRGDEYSAGHVLYEIGTLVFHFDLEVGIAIMENVLVQCDQIPALEQYERTLIETQLLMGKLLWAAEHNNYTALKKVQLECRRLLEIGRVFPHSYERFLCLTMRGICIFLIEHDIKKAQDSFFESLRCAMESDMPNLEWKAMFHIAQMCALDINSDPKVYVEEVKRYIENTVVENPRLQVGLRKMFQPVLAQLVRISAHEDMNSSNPDIGTMISVSAGGCLFVIMN